MIFKIHDVQQKTLEWHRLRRGYFTASTMGKWIAEEKSMRLEKKDLMRLCDAEGRTFSNKDTIDLMVTWLKSQSPESYAAELTYSNARNESWRNAVRKMAAFHTSPKEAAMVAQWEGEQIEKYGEDWTPDKGNYHTRRGDDLECKAREAYQTHTRHLVKEVGFISRGDLLGASPDGLIHAFDGDLYEYSHGLELKVPEPATWDEWSESPGVVPEEHEIQVQHSLAVSGLPRWDFCAWHPDRGLFIVEVYRSIRTQIIERNLLELEAETMRRINLWTGKEAA